MACLWPFLAGLVKSQFTVAVTHPGTIRRMLFSVYCGNFDRSIYDLDSCLGSEPGCRSIHSVSPVNSVE